MLLLSSALFSLFAGAASAEKSNLTVSLCNAGERQQFETVTCDIELKNSGDKPLRVFAARAGFRSDSIEPDVVVPAHGAAYLRATVKIADSVGFVHRFFSFNTDEPGKLANRSAQVQAFASTVLDSATPSIDFGFVRLDEPLPSKSITLTSREARDFRILEVRSKPDYVDVSVSADGRTIDASVRKDAPWGLFHERIKLRINAPQQPEAWIKLEGNVQGDVVPDSNPMLLGLMRTNRQNDVLVRLSSRAGKDFKIGAVTLKGFNARTTVLPCKPSKVGCRLIKLAISKDQMLGRVSGVLSVELPDFKQTLPVELGGGLLLGPDVEVKDMNKAIEKSQEEQGNLGSKVEAPSEKVDIKQAINQSILRKEQTVPPSGTGPLLRWAVEHQFGYHGFIIYRSDTEEGPFLRVNKELIGIVNDEGSSSGSYQWRDNSAVAGQVYWYMIGLVKDDGEKEPLSGKQRVVAK